MKEWLRDPTKRAANQAESNEKCWTTQRFTWDEETSTIYRKSSKGTQVVVPESEIWSAVVKEHLASGHSGKEATARALARTTYGFTREDVAAVLNFCRSCH